MPELPVEVEEQFISIASFEKLNQKYGTFFRVLISYGFPDCSEPRKMVAPCNKKALLLIFLPAVLAANAFVQRIWLIEY